MVRVDFWMALTRFMAELSVEMRQYLNCAAIDLFGQRHAKEVLKLFGQAYGALPGEDERMTRDQREFLDEAVHELAREDNEERIAPVRLALFAQMLSEEEWTPLTLQSVGGAKGVGVRFLEETFDTDRGRIRYNIGHSDLGPCRLILKALLPDLGMGIKGGRKSELELLKSSGLERAPDRFRRLIGMLDGDLRMITPTASEEVEGESATVLGEQIVRYYQLTHDYLVPSIREWLTRKQRETRRGRAELRLADRSAIWAAKPENRQLPSLWEWSNIRLLTESKDWTEPQRKMMRRAGLVKGRSAFGAIVVGTGMIILALIYYADNLVRQLRTAEITKVPDIVLAMQPVHFFTDRANRNALRSKDEDQKLRASLALLPVDTSQVDYLFNRLLSATPSQLPVLRDALKTHSSTLTPQLWSVLEKMGDANLLPSASALASYAPDDAKWEAEGAKVAQALVSVNSISLGDWLKYLTDVRSKLNPPLATIFRGGNLSESERTQVTNILTDYASDDPDLLANLLMDAEPKAYAALFPIVEGKAGKTLPLFRAEITRRATPEWNDPPLDPSWTKPDASLICEIEAAQGMVADRFAFCQTMPLDEFLTTAEALRNSGYRPVRSRPYADGPVVRVAAVWTWDGRPWRIASGLTAEEVRTQDERNRADKFLPVDVAGYVAVTPDGKPDDRYAAIWVEKDETEDEARMYLGATSDDHTAVMEGLKAKSLFSRTIHLMRGLDDRLRYCGVCGRSPVANPVGQMNWDQSEGAFGQALVTQANQLLLDVAVSGAGPAQSPRERHQAALEVAEKTLRAKPDDLNARYARAVAHLMLGENQKAIDDLNLVIEKAPQAAGASRYRAIAHARLGKKTEALGDLAKAEFQEGVDSQKLCLAAVVVAAELDEGADRAIEALEKCFGSGPRTPGSTTSPPALTPSPPRPSPRSTRAGAGSGRSGLSGYSRRRSGPAMPTTGTCRRTPTSTRSGTTRRSPRLCGPGTPTAATPPSGPALRPSSRRLRSTASPPTPRSLGAVI